MKRLLAILCYFLAGVASGASVSLAWDAPADVTGITGYRVAYGTQSGAYTQTLDAGNSLTAAVSGLADGTTYYFAAQSYGNAPDSVYSNEVRATTPVPPPPPPPPPGDTTPPVVAISLVDGQVLRGNGKTTITATATDDVGVTMVTLSIDGAVTSSTNSSSLSYQWNLKNVARGQHTISMTARDAAGNQATNTITVTRQ